MDSTSQPVIPAEFEPIEPLDDPLPGAPISIIEADEASPPGLDALHDIPVTVQAVLGGARMRVDALLATRAGTVIELDRRAGEPVDLLVNERLIARGELVLVDGALGVTLTEIVCGDR